MLYQSLLWYKTFGHVKLIGNFHKLSCILEEFGQLNLIINANLETVRTKLSDLNAQETEYRKKRNKYRNSQKIC